MTHDSPSWADGQEVAARLRAAGCVFAEAEARLLLSGAQTSEELDALVTRRVAGVPIEHVLGWAEFCGLRVAVSPGVFVPRKRTEFLVAEAAALAAHDRTNLIVDVCCGSGAVGMALAARLGTAEVHAVDIDHAAVLCARENLALYGGAVYEGDLFAPLPARLRGRVDVLVANAPYVPTHALATLPAEARDFEPLAALDGGPDGIGIQRRVAAAAAPWLAPGGHLLIETSERQAEATAEAVTLGGLLARIASSAEMDATVVIGRAPGLRQPD